MDHALKARVPGWMKSRYTLKQRAASASFLGEVRSIAAAMVVEAEHATAVTSVPLLMASTTYLTLHVAVKRAAPLRPVAEKQRRD